MFTATTFNIGFRRIPQTAAEALVALRCILSGLKWLHERGVVHRDSRWPNVLKVDLDRFIIIDLEMCARMDVSRAAAPWPDAKYLREEFWPARVMSEQGGWTPQHDIKQMVTLMWTAPTPPTPPTPGASDEAPPEARVPAHVLADAAVWRVLAVLESPHAVATAEAGLAALPPQLII